MTFVNDKKKTICCVLLAVLVLVIAAYYLFDNQNKIFIPKEVKTVTKTYLSLCKEGDFPKALEYCYYKEGHEFYKNIPGREPLKAYKIEEFYKINDKLYEVTIIYNNNKAKRVRNYVGNIDGKYYFIVNQRDIPDNIKEDFLDPLLQEDISRPG